jgi:hypothetical protein
MTQTSDMDRLLGEWLADGPNRAPDQPILAAAQFARAHPRRPDPLRLLRSDPMADRRRRPFAVRPGLVFALLALVLAIVAAGVIGSRRNEQSIVPPSQPATSDQPTSRRTQLPTPAPSASPSAAPLLSLDLADSGGNPASLDVVDLSGLVVSATSALPIESDAAASDSSGGMVIRNATASSLRITWQGSPCDTIHRMTVDATATHILLERPKCFGDAIARYLSVTLVFRESVVASDVKGSIVDGSGGAGGPPNWTVIGPDTAGNAFHISIYDATASITSADGSNDGTGGAALPPNTGRLDATPYDEIRLVWSRSPCVLDERLTIDATGRILTLSGAPCSPSTPVFDRELRLQFAKPADASQMRLVVDLALPVPS